MNETKRGTQRRFISLRVKLLVGFTVLFSVVFAGAYYWFYNFATDFALRRIEEDMVDTLKAMSAGVNVDEMLALYNEGQVNDAGFSDDSRFINQLGWLDEVHNIEPRAWPYTYVKGQGQNEVVFINDLWSKYDASKSTKFREIYTSTGPLIRGLAELTVVTEAYTDPWGNWVSAYTPLKNAQGEIVGGLGLDFRADYVFQVQDGIRRSVIVAFIITYAVLFVLVYALSGALTQPIRKLTQTAHLISEGKYERAQADLGREGGSDLFPDEINTLTGVFSSMVGQVYQREENLRRKVEELKIEIDEVKRKKQVDEIVESDFFQDLQAKAKSVRNRSKPPPA